MLHHQPDWFEGRSQAGKEWQMTAEVNKESLIILRDIKLGVQTIETNQGEIEGRLSQVESKSGIKPPN